MPMNPEQLVQKLSTALVDAGCRVCTAESCTGGLIAKTGGQFGLVRTRIRNL
jgi:nicotinamide mononucleotide (NMN) deamidase PncC